MDKVSLAIGCIIQVLLHVTKLPLLCESLFTNECFESHVGLPIDVDSGSLFVEEFSSEALQCKHAIIQVS